MMNAAATSAASPVEPLSMDLLRRARSKGFGMLLASQNPGDFAGLEGVVEVVALEPPL